MIAAVAHHTGVTPAEQLADPELFRALVDRAAKAAEAEAWSQDVQRSIQMHLQMLLIVLVRFTGGRPPKFEQIDRPGTERIKPPKMSIGDFVGTARARKEGVKRAD